MTSQQQCTRQNDRSRRLILVLFTAVSIPTITISLFERWAGREEPSLSHLRVSRFLEDQETCTESCCQQFQQECPSGNPLNFLPLALQIVLIVVLLISSGLFSGLTLGLMSLDITGLEIVMSGENRQNAEYAEKIYPVRQDGNLLLCTLLLGNVAVNALLSILLADKAGGIVGFVASTFLIVIFGEIAPQAFCSRHGLKVGSLTVSLVRVIMVLLYPITKPLALSLDYALGEELATVYSSSEIRKMLEIHVQENALDKETANTMTGALLFKDIPVKQVMTPIDNTFMLSIDEKLNFQTISDIFKTGYSRIPVFEVNRNNVIGLLLVKDLIFVDPEDDTRVSDVINIFGRSLNTVWPDDKLGDVLRELKTGRSHMALVRDVNNDDDTQDPFYEIKGIITLEDIIEEILGAEIVDETDAFVDGTHMEPVTRTEVFEWARLRLLDAKLVDERLSDEETMAVTAHLYRNYHRTVELLTDRQLERLVSGSYVITLPEVVKEIGQPLPKDLIYSKGEATEVCTLVLSGKVTVFAGEENFRTDLGSWSLLGVGALTNAAYKPDFDAFVSSGPCRCIRITRTRFNAAIDASAAERQAENNMPVDSQDSGSNKASSHSVSGEINSNIDMDEMKQRARKGQMLVALQLSETDLLSDGLKGGSADRED